MKDMRTLGVGLESFDSEMETSSSNDPGRASRVKVATEVGMTNGAKASIGTKGAGGTDVVGVSTGAKAGIDADGAVGANEVEVSNISNRHDGSTRAYRADKVKPANVVVGQQVKRVYRNGSRVLSSDCYPPLVEAYAQASMWEMVIHAFKEGFVRRLSGPEAINYRVSRLRSESPGGGGGVFSVIVSCCCWF